MKHSCIYWSGLLGTLGVATVAWAQAPATAATPLGPEFDATLELLRVGGLPAVLLYLGWILGKGFPTLQVSVTVDQETKDILKQIAAGRNE